LISAPSRSHYCQQSTPSVRADVCLSRSFKLLLLFLVFHGIEPVFGRHFSICPSTKLCSSIFDLGPLRPKIYSPNLHKIAHKSACMAAIGLDRRCLGRAFRGWPIQWNHGKCCGADPCFHGNEIWARRGDPVPYLLVIIMSPLRRHIFVCFMAKSAFWRGFSALRTQGSHPYSVWMKYVVCIHLYIP